MEKRSLGSKLYAVFRMSLSGDQRDYTQGNLSKAIVLLAIPMILELSLESVFAVVDILSLMGADEQVIREGAVFTRIMFGSSLVIMLLFLINGIFRGAGDAAMAM